MYLLCVPAHSRDLFKLQNSHNEHLVPVSCIMVPKWVSFNSTKSVDISNVNLYWKTVYRLCCSHAFVILTPITGSRELWAYADIVGNADMLIFYCLVVGHYDVNWPVLSLCMIAVTWQLCNNYVIAYVKWQSF